jgi:hypothetical protein
VAESAGKLMAKREYILVSKPDWPRPQIMQTTDRDKLYWGNGPQHCHIADDMVIVKSFGQLDSRDDDDYDTIEAIEFDLEDQYPPEKGQKDSEGWLAPDGTYYPCASSEHDSAARSITAVLFRSWDGTRMLEDKGWMRVCEGYILYDHNKVTQRQIDTIFDLTQITTGELKETLDRRLSWLTDQV